MPRDAAAQQAKDTSSVERMEANLLARTANGDSAAFEQLYRIYHPRLSRFLHRILRQAGLIEEVLNDAMWVVWNRAGSYDGSCKVSTWVFAIAYRKGLKALSRLDEPVDDRSDDHLAPAESGPEERAVRSELRAALLEALDQLSLEQRAVMHLTYFHGIGYREIGEIVGCPVDTVKSRMFYARQKLKGILHGRLEDWL